MRRTITFMLLYFCLFIHAEQNVHITHFNENDGFAQSMVTCIIQDHNGFIWLSTWDGLSKYDGYTFKNYKARPGDNCPLTVNRIDCIRETQGHDILCKSSNKHYYIFHRKSGTFEYMKGKTSDGGKRFHPSDNIKKMIASLDGYRNIEVRILLVDRQGGIWVYTHHGLDRITFAKQTINTVKCGSEGEEQIRGLYIDHAGNTWTADKNGCVRLTDQNNRLIGYVARDGKLSKARVPFGHKIYTIFQDAHGIYWLGSKPDGLFRLQSQNGGFIVGHFYNSPHDRYSISNNEIYAIAEDCRQRLWIGTYGGGLNMMTTDKTGRTVFLNRNNTLNTYPAAAREIRCIKILKGDIMLIGTNEGLYTCRLSRQMPGMRFFCNRRIPSDRESLSNNQVMDILSRSNGDIYIATYGGGTNRIVSHNLLCNSIKFSNYSTESGLSSDINMALTEDKAGNLWIVSEASLCCLNPQTGLSTNYMKTFFTGGFIFTEVHPICLASGRLIFGTTQGTLAFNPSQVEKSHFIPRIVFDCPSVINLKPEDKSISIEFAALDYNKNEDILYAYKLEGVDKKWLYTKDNRINYANIPAGTFRLHVKSTNGDGIWTDNEASVIIHRTPYFNETPLAWMIYGIALLLSLLIIAKVIMYIRQLQHEISDIRLTTNEKIEYLGDKLHEMLSSKQEKSIIRIEEAETESTKSQFVNKVTDFINKNIDNTELTVDDFAKEMGMSRTVFYVQMKKVFDRSPNNFIQDIRIERAKQLMTDKDANISDIAYRCGFSDPKYFSRCFKKATGLKPSEYQKGNAAETKENG